jgi:hypothetical protein
MKTLMSIILAFLLGACLGRRTASPLKNPEERTDRASLIPRDRNQSKSLSFAEVLKGWPKFESGDACRNHWDALHRNPYLRQRELLKRLLASEWVSQDGESAMAFALGLTNEDRRMFLTESFHAKASLGLSHLRAIAGRENWVSFTTDGWLKRAEEQETDSMAQLVSDYGLGKVDEATIVLADPESALRVAEEIEDDSARDKKISEICQAWYRRDPEAAWVYAKAHVSPIEWQSLSDSLFDDWMRKDAPTAFKYRRDLSMLDTDASYWYERLGTHWPKGDFESVLIAVKDTAPGEGRRSTFVAGLVHVGHVTAIDQGFALLETLPQENHGNGRWGALDAIQTFFLKHGRVEEAKHWAKQLPDPRERLRMLGGLPNYRADPEEIMETVRMYPDDARHFIDQVANTSGMTLSELHAWIGRLPEDQQNNAHERILTQLKPEEAIRYGEDHLKGHADWSSWQWQARKRWAEKDPMAALESVQPDEEIVKDLLQIWSHTGLPAAEAWVASQAHESLTTVFGTIQLKRRLRDGDRRLPEMAEEASRLPDAGIILSRVLERWARVDPEAVLAFDPREGSASKVQRSLADQIQERIEFLA